jgi:hypothetical protein
MSVESRDRKLVSIVKTVTPGETHFILHKYGGVSGILSFWLIAVVREGEAPPMLKMFPILANGAESLEEQVQANYDGQTVLHWSELRDALAENWTRVDQSVKDLLDRLWGEE